MQSTITKETFRPADPYNLTAAEEQFLGTLSTAELRELAIRDSETAQQKADFQAKVDTYEQDRLDQRFEDKSAEEIRLELARKNSSK